MRITDKSDYCFRVLIYLVQNSSFEEKAKIQEISDYFSISKNHLKVVVNKLSSEQLIETSLGPNGGIVLKKETLNVKLGDLFQRLESMDTVECFDPERNRCVITPTCKLKGFLKKANKAYVDSLNKYRVRDLI